LKSTHRIRRRLEKGDFAQSNPDYDIEFANKPCLFKPTVESERCRELIDIIFLNYK
jgi:hypothetical protein